VKSWAEFNDAVLFKSLTAWLEPDNEYLNDSAVRFEFGDVGWYEVCDQTSWVKLPEFNFKTVESYGGEGQGDEYWFVIQVELSDRILHYKIEGYYQSYDGGYYESIRQVTPKDKVITIWT
jgi:hypothetical protein